MTAGATRRPSLFTGVLQSVAGRRLCSPHAAKAKYGNWKRAAPDFASRHPGCACLLHHQFVRGQARSGTRLSQTVTLRR